MASVFRSGTCLHDKRGHRYLRLEGKYGGNRASRRVQVARGLFDTTGIPNYRVNENYQILFSTPSGISR